MIIKKFNADDIMKITGDLKISPSVQIVDPSVTIEARGDGYITIQMNTDNNLNTFYDLTQFGTMQLPCLVVITACTIGNSMRIKSSGNLEQVIFNH